MTRSLDDERADQYRTARSRSRSRGVRRIDYNSGRRDEFINDQVYTIDRPLRNERFIHDDEDGMYLPVSPQDHELDRPRHSRRNSRRLVDDQNDRAYSPERDRERERRQSRRRSRSRSRRNQSRHDRSRSRSRSVRPALLERRKSKHSSGTGEVMALQQQQQQQQHNGVKDFERYFDASYDGFLASAAGAAIGVITAKKFGGDEHAGWKRLAGAVAGATAFNVAENRFRAYAADEERKR